MSHHASPVKLAAVLVVAAVMFLASPEAGFITGQHLVVDGSMTRRMIYAD